MQLIQDVTGASFTQTSMMDSCRHFAPETLVDDGVMSRASDIYALGMTILEVIKASPAFVYWSRWPPPDYDTPAAISEHQASSFGRKQRSEWNST